MKLDKKKKIIIAVVAVIAVIAIGVGVFFGINGKKEEPVTENSTVSTTQAPKVLNPLTGEAGFNENALGKRPVSVVVENAKGARPQYNINTPDIIVEGEVEGGATRMLWLYADYTKLPEIVGPCRSARPSFVEFSQFFDSIFFHFGGSHSKGNYVGGYEVIDKKDVDHVDGIKSGSYFKRTSDKKNPHNAVLIGKKAADAISDKKIRTDLNKEKSTKLSFYDTLTPVSNVPCNEIDVKISSRTDTHKLQYDSTKNQYVNKADYETPVSFTNVMVMFADTTYIDKEDYKGSGKTETYLNYSLTSGTGKLASAGTVIDFNWSLDGNVITFTDVNGNPLKLNPGKTWIGLASSNHKGNVNIPAPQAEN